MKGKFYLARLTGFLTVMIIVSTMLPAQEEIVVPATKEELEKAYQENISQSRLYGVYIPKDVDDAFNEFIALSTGEDIAKFKSADEDLVVKKLHFGIGRWMAVNWCFYEGSRLSHHLKEKGIGNPDDMISFLIRAFHRKLNDKPVEAERIISQLAEARKKALEEQLKKE